MKIFTIGKLKSTPDEVFGTHKRNSCHRWQQSYSKRGDQYICGSLSIMYQFASGAGACDHHINGRRARVKT